MNTFKKLSVILAATLLLAGQATGIYFIAIPIASGLSGFIPSVAAAILTWLCVYAISLLYAEALFRLPPGANFLTFLGFYFGHHFKLVVGAFFLFSYNYYIIASFIALFPSLHSLLFSSLSVELSSALCSLFITLFLGLFLALGFNLTALINSLLMVGLSITLYLFLNGIAVSFSLSRLFEHDWSLSFYAIPTFFGAYGFQTLIPTIMHEIKRDRTQLHFILFWGSFLPCLAFILLNFFVLGSLSEETIWSAFETKEVVAQGFTLFQTIASGNEILPWFYIFIVVTSLIPNLLTLVDCYGDQEKIAPAERKGRKRLALTLLTILPGAFLSVLYPEIFNETLNAINGFGQIFFSFLPIFAVWKLRYDYCSEIPPFLLGNKGMLIALILILIFFVWVQGISLIQ